MDFRWNNWNLEHVAHHGVSIDEAEMVVTQARPPFPEQRGGNKWAVWGRGLGGRFIQVVYVFDPDGTLYIIHARLLTDVEKKRLRKRRR